MTFLETEMKELGRSTWNDTQHNIVDPYLSSMSQTSHSRKKLSRWKSINTHTRAHTHTCARAQTQTTVRRCSWKQLFLKILQIHRNTPVLESLFMFPCEYGKITPSCRTPLVTDFVPCFFLKLFRKLFIQLYYLFDCLNKTLYLRCITNTCHFLIFFCILTKQANVCSNSAIKQHAKY